MTGPHPPDRRPYPELAGWIRVVDVPPGIDDCYVAYDIEEDGHRVIAGLFVCGQDITARQLRELKPGQIARQSWVDGKPVRHTTPSLATMQYLMSKDHRAFCAAIAQEYRSNLMCSRTPVKLMANEWGIPIRRVRQWVQRARHAGALPIGRKGRAG